MNKFVIKTGQYQVAESGVFHLIEDETTTLSLGDTNFLIIFEKNKDEKQGIQFKTIDSKNAELRLVNANGPLGYGTTRPFQIGEADGKKLFLTFVTRSLNDTYLRTFEYTLYTL